MLSPDSTRNMTQQQIAHIRQMLCFLVFDLSTFQSNPSAEKHLSVSVSRHCVGPPYLADELEATLALDCTLGALGNGGNDEAGAMKLGTYLDQQADKLMEARRLKAGSDDFVICTSHDLAPILQRALGLSKGFEDSKAFKKYKAWDRGIAKDSTSQPNT